MIAKRVILLSRRFPAVVLLLLLSISPANAQDAITPIDPQLTTTTENQLTEAEKSAGWVLMFDGKTLDGWRNFGSDGSVKNWQVDHGALSMQPSWLGTLKYLLSYLIGSRSGDLIYSRAEYENFELQLEWKISDGGNSGIFYLVQEQGHQAPWETGMEMQVLDNEGHDDGQIVKHRAGDLYDLIASSSEPVKPPGQWNHVRIIKRGKQIEHWINATKVVQYIHGDQVWDELVANSKFKSRPQYGRSNSGFIVLQDHSDKVWYRNLKIRQLDVPANSIQN